MRINIYSEELTDKTELVTKEANGHIFHGLRIFLEGSPSLHRDADDNDETAITFWYKDEEKELIKSMLRNLVRRFDDNVT